MSTNHPVGFKALAEAVMSATPSMVEELLRVEFAKRQRHVIDCAGEEGLSPEVLRENYLNEAATWAARAEETAPQAPWPPRLTWATIQGERTPIRQAIDEVRAWAPPRHDRSLDDVSHVGRQLQAKVAEFCLRMADGLVVCACS